MLFLGTHTPKLDDKGRMFLPAKFRDRLVEGGMVITRGQERCLYIYPRATFEERALQLQSAPTSNRVARDQQRMFLSGAYDEAPDKQGRLTIPQMLRDYAGLSTECTVIGAGDRLEIWDTASWNAYLEATEDSFAEQSEEVVPGLL